MIFPRRGTAAAAALVLGATVLAGCGGGPPARSAAVGRTCQLVSAVLSDGPDPSADPVGYAEAQILPLRQIHTSDRSLRLAIDELAAAYQRYFDTGGGKGVKRAVSRASSRVDALCPGATS